MKVLTVVGNRPQFIKSAPLSLALRAAGIEEVVLHTGQHYDRELSQVFFDELSLEEPRHRLATRSADPAVMRPGITVTIEAERPDWVLVFGDTNSTLAGAQAGTDTGTPVAHVEAGLRSGDWTMPEERNRVEVDQLAALLLCPDERSRVQLEREAVPGRAAVVGDVMADAARLFAPLARDRVPLDGLEPGRYAVATVHRLANVSHPRTRAALAEAGIELGPNVRLVEPLGYFELAALASQARVILTDSGGLQKEAYWYGVPCVTMRPSTEWLDTVEVGANVLVDDDPDRIAAAAAEARMPAERPLLYGDGHASERVVDELAPVG
jgi:UDP-N-acetylglucosamine 2-epimerase